MTPLPAWSLSLLALVAVAAPVGAADLRAGTAVVDITDHAAGPVHDPALAKALVLEQDGRTAVLVTIDAVAIGGIGRIDDAFLPALRARVARESAIPPDALFVNASHCHATVRTDLVDLVAGAVAAAKRRLEPVAVGAGSATESRISENRRLSLADGSQADMRRAYSLPADDAIAAVGPIDPTIGLLRIDRIGGGTLAVVYLFACHPIMNPPAKGSSADFPGVASRLVETALGGDAVAFFVQGCGGDVNPVRYKEIDRAPDAEPLGRLLGGSVLEGLAAITPRPGAPLAVARETVALPRAADIDARITRLLFERERTVAGLTPTNLSFADFVGQLVARGIDPESPGASRQRLLHDDALGRSAPWHDAAVAAEVAAYRRNIDALERLTRLNTNLALLRQHRERRAAATEDTVAAELGALRVGEFRVVTFPGELVVETGRAVRRAAGEGTTFVAGYTDGYLHYLPTPRQRANTGFAQEDCDCLVAAEWEEVFTTTAATLLRRLDEAPPGAPRP
ncbi:MAG: hypothetical protein ACKO9B_07690 [Planctomycetota bacterium]